MFEETKVSHSQVEYKIFIIGDQSSGKSELMGKYFNINPKELEKTLTKMNMVSKVKETEYCEKPVKITCVDSRPENKNNH
jgi:GTPase SAR1 family protein